MGLNKKLIASQTKNVGITKNAILIAEGAKIDEVSENFAFFFLFFYKYFL